jgi:hypothetical protein
MYSEGNNPVIESPFSAATSIHDMLLQSWDGKIRVFPAVPTKWGDIYFKNFRTQGGFLVSADLSDGTTTFVTIKSPEKNKEVAFTIPIKKPKFTIVNTAGKEVCVKLKKQKNGFYKISLKKGDVLQIKNKKSVQTTIVNSAEKEANLFGHNKQYDKFLKTYKGK